VVEKVLARAGAVTAALALAAVCACSGGKSSAPAGAAVGGAPEAEAPVPEEEPAPPLEDEEDADDVDAEPGTLEVKVVWPTPAAPLRRPPGRSPGGRPRPAPLQVEPAGVIAGRSATERIVAVAGAVVPLSGVGVPPPERAAPPLLEVRGCALEP